MGRKSKYIRDKENDMHMRWGRTFISFRKYWGDLSCGVCSLLDLTRGKICPRGEITGSKEAECGLEDRLEALGLFRIKNIEGA